MTDLAKLNSKKELGKLLEALERRKGKKYFRWVQDYWTARGEPLEFIKHKYLVQIYQDQSRDIVYKKSAQAGLSERMATEAMWLPDNYKENSLYVFPTSGTVSDFVQERIDEPINNNSYLAMVSGRSKKIMGKQADKVGMKRMSKGFIYFRGANRPTQITSVPADIIFVDELDRMSPESVAYLPKRLEHSGRKWTRYASTPTIPNFGIDKRFNETDQMHCNVKCTHCNEWQKLTFWDNIDERNELLICAKCKKQIIPWECEMEWIPETDSNIRGYFINQLYSPFLDIKKLIEASKKTDEFEIQQFYNQNLGLAYEPKGSKITEQDLQACTRDYTIPFKSEEDVMMGVDVGKVLHYVIRTKNRLIDAGEVKSFSELGRLATENNVKCCVIDALPETRKCQEFATRFPGRVYLCYYSGLVEVKEGQWFKTSPQKINTDRTISLDKSQDEIKTQKIELPKNLPQDFINHCKNLTRVIEEKDGKAKAVYVKLGDDHLRHAYNYSCLAKNIWDRNVEPEILVF